MTARNLVIGASGLVGSAIAAHAGPHVVRAMVDWSTPRSAVESLRPTLREFLLHGEGRRSQQRIYWAAGRTVISSHDSEIDRELETFQAVSEFILKQAVSSVVFVLVSSAGALFRGTRGAAITEAASPNPTSAYGTMKLAQERLISAGSSEYGHCALILRAPTVYGPHQDPTKQQGLISALIRSIYTRSLVSIFVPRDTRRHYLWADDLARIALALPDRISISPGTSSVRIVTTDRSRTIDEVIETLARVARRRPTVRFMPTHHSHGHGLDLTQSSDFFEIRHLGPFTPLTDGIYRLLWNHYNEQTVRATFGL